MSAPSSASSAPRRVLIVGAEQSEADWLRQILEKEGYEVRLADSFSAATEAVRAWKPELVIADAKAFPADDVVVAPLKASGKTLVIVITALANPDDLVASLNIEADSYLTRPFEPEFLLSRVQSALRVKPGREAEGEPIHVEFHGREHSVRTSRRRLLDLLAAVYESAVYQSHHLSRIREELQAANKRLSRDHGMLRTLIDALPDSIYVKDADGRYILDNIAHMRHVGVESSDHIVGKTVFDFFPEEIAERFHADDQAIIRLDSTLVNREEPIVDDDGAHRWVSTTKVPFRNTAGRILGLVCLSRDITEEKRAKEDLLRAHMRLKEAHESLRALQMQLVEAEKMKSIGRLAAGVAHEVKNPLAIITMGMEYLSHLDFGKDVSAPCILKEVSTALKRADHVIRGLLDFSAPKQLDATDEDLNAVIEEALTLMRGLFEEKKIAVIRELDSNIPVLRIDRTKVSQVIVNLLTNAADAVPNTGGRITVRTSSRQLTGVGSNIGDARSEVFRAGDRIVTAEIEDNGAGIPKDKLEKIFDPFFTTKPTGHGTGLGLSVSRTIMDLHGGVIDVANREEGGARLTIMFKADGTSFPKASPEI